MALVVEGFEILLTAVDNGGNIVRKTYVCNPALVTNITEAQTARTALITQFNANSQLVITGTRLTEVQFEDSIVYPASNVEAEDKASITTQILGKNKKANIKIPAPNPAIFVGTSGSAANQINVQDAVLQGYLGMYDGATGYFTLSDGEVIDTTINGTGAVVGKRVSAKNNNG